MESLLSEPDNVETLTEAWKFLLWKLREGSKGRKFSARS
jgi:hypothetical protein